MSKLKGNAKNRCFAWNLLHVTGWDEWIVQITRLRETSIVGIPQVIPESAPHITNQELIQHLRQIHWNAIAKEAEAAKITSFIPIKSRNCPGLYLADVSLKGSLEVQSILFKYRQGMFLMKKECICGVTSITQRGHEMCKDLNRGDRLSRVEQQQKAQAQAKLNSEVQLFTTIDWMINQGELTRAAAMLKRVKTQLHQFWSRKALSAN